MTTTALPTLTKKDFQTDQEVRWCPGCGDYAILAAVQAVFPELGIARENFVDRFRYWLLEPVPLLHEYLRVPHHPRARTRGCNRDQSESSGFGSVGCDRRRRRTVHWR